jgi:hypothetical protein
MTYENQGIGGSAPRWLRLSRRGRPGRGRQIGGIAIAIVGAGLTAGLTACQPVGVAAASGHPQGGHSATSSSGQQTTTSTKSSSGTGSTMSSSGSGAYSFTTMDNPADPTFNQLLGFNNDGMIAGYFGSGAAGHPNKGYVLVRTRRGFVIDNENFPGAVQTQVTGINDRGITVGFWSTQNTSSMSNNNFGFYWQNGRFHSVNFPTGDNASPPVNQLLGVNDSNIAIGFYTNGQGSNRGYEYNIRTRQFTRVLVPGAAAGVNGPSLTASAIDNNGDVAGFYNKTSSQVDAFLKLRSGRFITLAYPGASMTQAFGVNDFQEVVGTYTVGTGNSAATHGFTWTPERGFKSVDDPQGVGATTINGVNDSGDIVGFFTDSAGYTDGFAAVPAGRAPLPGLIGVMTPAPSTSPSTSMPTTTPATSKPSTPSTTPTTSMPTSAPTGGTTTPASPNPLQPTHW